MALKRVKTHAYTKISEGINWIIDNTIRRPIYACPFADRCDKSNRFNSMCFDTELFTHVCRDWKRLMFAHKSGSKQATHGGPDVQGE